MKLVKVILQKKRAPSGVLFKFKKKEKMKIIVKQYSVKKGDKFESPNGDYKYIIKDIDYSSTPNMVQMMYADSGSIHKREAFTIKLPVLLSYIEHNIINRI